MPNQPSGPGKVSDNPSSLVFDLQSNSQWGLTLGAVGPGGSEDTSVGCGDACHTVTRGFRCMTLPSVVSVSL